MAHYVIGDVQGCFEELLDLTKLIEFSSINDKLIFAGDLVNRGPQSLEVLDFCLKIKMLFQVCLEITTFIYCIFFNTGVRIAR